MKKISFENKEELIRKEKVWTFTLPEAKYKVFLITNESVETSWFFL